MVWCCIIFDRTLLLFSFCSLIALYFWYFFCTISFFFVFFLYNFNFFVFFLHNFNCFVFFLYNFNCFVFFLYNFIFFVFFLYNFILLCFFCTISIVLCFFCKISFFCVFSLKFHFFCIFFFSSRDYRWCATAVTHWTTITMKISIRYRKTRRKRTMRYQWSELPQCGLQSFNLKPSVSCLVATDSRALHPVSLVELHDDRES